MIKAITNKYISIMFKTIIIKIFNNKNFMFFF